MVLLIAVIVATPACSSIKQWIGHNGDFDKKHIRQERKVLREQMEEDELWGGNDEYNSWEENDEYDRDRW